MVNSSIVTTIKPLTFKSKSFSPELAKILRERYGQANGSWDELCHRVSKKISESEKSTVSNYWFEQFYQVISKGIFIPAGRTLLASSEALYPSCCVLGVLTKQNYEEKFILAYKLAATGTGSGFNLSSLSDPVNAIYEISAATKEATFGKSRQSANIFLLDIEHPKILKFINCKNENPQKMSNVTLSVCISDKWMRSLKNGNRKKLNLIAAIAESAWKTGDPGIVFNCNVKDPILTPFGNPNCCSPCGELYMHEYESCSLGSINLNSPYLLTKKDGLLKFNFDFFRKVIRVAVRFLDDVIDQYDYIDDKLLKVAMQTRRIGLGVAGFADLLKMLKFPYDSDKARNLGSQIAKTLTKVAEDTSKQLAREKGGLKFAPKYRNISLTCIAPTGNISRLMKELTGNNGYAIEPMFDEAVCVNPLGHLRMIQAWQPNIQNAISKTVNLDQDCSVQDIQNVFIKAYEFGLKGITVFRNNCRESVFQSQNLK